MHQLILCIWYFAIATKTKISCVACLTVLRSSSVGSEFFFVFIYWMRVRAQQIIFHGLVIQKWRNVRWWSTWNQNYYFIKPINFHQIFIKSRVKNLYFPINEFGLNKSQMNSMLESRSSMCNFTDNYNLFNINHFLIFLHLLEICCEIFITKTRREIINTFMIFDADLIES